MKTEVKGSMETTSHIYILSFGSREPYPIQHNEVHDGAEPTKLYVYLCAVIITINLLTEAPSCRASTSTSSSTAESLSKLWGRTPGWETPASQE